MHVHVSSCVASCGFELLLQICFVASQMLSETELSTSYFWTVVVPVVPLFLVLAFLYYNMMMYKRHCFFMCSVIILQCHCLLYIERLRTKLRDLYIPLFFLFDCSSSLIAFICMELAFLSPTCIVLKPLALVCYTHLLVQKQLMNLYSWWNSNISIASFKVI